MAVTNDLKDPRVGFVTITSVETSPDLRHARVYFSVLGDEEQRKDSMRGLISARGYLQARVGRELPMKHTPQLAFTYDDTADKGMRISELLRETGTDG